ncbi:MAG: hypothetical protein ACSHW0_17870 [Thalassotalea sp.]
MSSIWTNHARRLKELIDCNNEAQAHLFLEQLMLLPVDIQDTIIEEVSNLGKCSEEAIAHILNVHSMMELK